jgi:hypothetical protein
MIDLVGVFYTNWDFSSSSSLMSTAFTGSYYLYPDELSHST